MSIKIWGIFLFDFLRFAVLRLSLAFCILLSARQSFAMINGQIADDAHFNSVIAIPDCSAVVAHPQLLISAAHCLYSSEKPFNMHVGFKSNNLRDTLRIQRVIRHPLYNSKFVNNDIELIILQNPIEENEILQAIMPVQKSFVSGLNKFIAVGFGDSELARYGEFGVSINMEKRMQNFELSFINQNVLELQTKSLRTGACHGDSGGGVFQIQEDGSLTLAGIMSSITGQCGRISTKLDAVLISPHLEWIKNNSGVSL